NDNNNEKLIYILSKIGIGNVYNLVYDYAVKHPDSRYAIKAIANFDKKESIDFLQEKLKQNPRVLHRELMVECLGNYKKSELVNIIKEYLADEDRQVRFQAVYALFNTGGKEAALAMCNYISDPDEWISMTILRLLCRMRELDTIPILIDKYHSDKDLRRKALMISFLSRFQSITLLGAFDDALHARDARLRANAIEAIGDLKLTEEELLGRITPYLNDPNNRIRANAILALAKITPEKVKAQIVEMCNSDDVQLRRSAAFILCMIPPNDFFKEAEKLIVDENETVRKRMIQSLKNFPHEFISSNINKVLSDENKWIRKYAVDMVAGIPAFESTPLVNILKSEQAAPNIESCLNFLVTHPSDSAMNSLRVHFKDKRLPVVKALLKALFAIGGIEEVKKVAPRFEQHDPLVVQNITSTMLEAGDVETLDEFLNRLERIKKQHHIELLLPTLEAIVDIIIKGEKMPPKLLKAFSNEISQVRPAFVPPQQPVQTPQFVQPQQQPVQTPQFVPPQQQPVAPQFVPPQQPVQEAPQVPMSQPPVEPAQQISGDMSQQPDQAAPTLADNETPQLDIDITGFFAPEEQPSADIPFLQEQPDQGNLLAPDDSGQMFQQLLPVDGSEPVPPMSFGDGVIPEGEEQNYGQMAIDLGQPQGQGDMSATPDLALPTFSDLSSFDLTNTPEVVIKK
ncbi:MAG: HEAT repeat domain-containing protein, partial [Candidatus Riflebacteria bacterium]|nr:HEAT repeat domain-containing protein [Candidatus Riflebacteria bacterium]